LPVSRRDGGKPETLGGDVHTLTRTRGAPRDAPRPDRAAFDRLDGELDRAVGEQDTVAGPQIAGKTRVRGGRAGLVPRTVGSQLEPLAGLEVDRVGVELPEPDLRPGQIDQRGEGASD